MKLRLRLLVVIGATLALATPASAQNDDSLAKRFTKGRRVKQRGSFAKLRGHKVSFAGRKTLTVGEITDHVFGDQRELAKEFKSAKSAGALQGDPVTVEEVIETDDAVVITTSTKVTVVDGDKMRKKSKRFGAFNAKAARAAKDKVAGFDRGTRAKFAKLRAEMRKLPADNPLRKAADKGEQELLDAIDDGQGDLTVESTIVIPKKAMKRTAKGELMVRTVDADGNVDFARPKKVKSVVDRGGTDTRASEETDLPPETSTRGKVTSRAKFLTGFTEADDFIWEKRWSFSFGYVSVKFHPWYEFGLRVPVEVTGVLDPKKIVHKGAHDQPEEFTVELSAKAFDAGPKYYEDTGLERSLVKDGNEFLLGVGFEIIIKVKAGSIVNKRWVVPKHAAFSMSQNFDPPFGNCGTKCGFELWIDPTLTHTKLSLLGIVTGAAQVGFNVSGKGEASVEFEALYGNDTIASWPAGKAGEKRQKHRVFFASTKDLHKYKAEAKRNAHPGIAKGYGYKLSAPRYDWSVVVTPGVKANIRVKAKPLLNKNFPIGPKWFDSFAIKLGTVKLNGHKGTKRIYKMKQGEKTWRVR